jgi:4-hydroxybenzoate polyprenyltransferase
MTRYVQLIRPNNLIIIALTQCLVYLMMIRKPLENHGIAIELDVFNFAVFCLTTLIMAGASYVINDYLDVRADLINKPEKTFAGQSVSLRNTFRFYLVLIVVGFIIAIYLAVVLSKIHLLWLYPTLTSLLYLYSKKYKHHGIIGNLIVSLFTAFVPTVLLLAEPGLIAPFSIEVQGSIFWSVLLLSLFAFLLNFSRELIKDIIDMPGDKINGTKSLALTKGIKTTVRLSIAVIYLAMTVCLLTIFLPEWTNVFHLRVYGILFIVAPMAYSNNKLVQARLDFEFKKISRIYKLVMVSGLIYFLMIFSAQ